MGSGVEGSFGMNFFSFVSAGTLTHIFGTAGEVLGVVGRWFDGLHPRRHSVAVSDISGTSAGCTARTSGAARTGPASRSDGQLGSSRSAGVLHRQHSPSFLR